MTTLELFLDTDNYYRTRFDTHTYLPRKKILTSESNADISKIPHLYTYFKLFVVLGNVLRLKLE